MKTGVTSTAEKPWAVYRRDRLIFWLLFAGLMPLWLLGALQNPTVNAVLPFAVVIWFASWVFFLIKTSLLVCPRCGRRFFISDSGWGNPYARKCLNCGLKKFEPTSGAI
jgi:hypothetical protein